VLAQTRAGWEKHKSKITQPWLDRNVSRFAPITPDDKNHALDQPSALAALGDATGVFICGGHTPTYHRLYATEPIGTAIRNRYHAGIPVAGVSAGALISLEICHLPRDETDADELQIVQGLCLARGFVIGVHFTRLNALPQVLAAMTRTGTGLGFGIDDSACVVCENGKFARALGESVFRIEMSDFAEPQYQIVPLQPTA
jgi:cyanophycinase